MASDNSADSLRMAALCKRLGRLCPAQEIDILEEELQPEQLDECRLLLVGKVLCKSAINIPALQSTLRRVWRIDQVDFSLREEGLYTAKFHSEVEKQRILEGGPWLFGNQLVILKPWVPNTPLHLYDFSRCAFWVQIFGLPLEWSSEHVICKALKMVGEVLEIKPSFHDGSSLKAGRVRVEVNLNEPLQSGKLLHLDGRTLWIDFRYERLSHFCYSYEKIGHYASYCPIYPFEEAKMDGKHKMAYGHWLRAEAGEHSPYWNVFYNPSEDAKLNDETVPETPPTLMPMVPMSTQQDIVIRLPSLKALHISDKGVPAPSTQP